MTLRRRIAIGAAAALACALAALALLRKGVAPSGGGDLSAPEAASAEGGVASAPQSGVAESAPEAASADVGEASVEGEPAEELSEEEAREREEDRLVESFEALTDRWMEPAAGGVSMDDVEAFSASFRRLPPARRRESLQRALNLVPDENVMLLAGILMDKSLDVELLDLVYGDVLNRDEDVKKPILQQIFKDKGHPCWADTAWILDVTGELRRDAAPR